MHAVFELFMIWEQYNISLRLLTFVFPTLLAYTICLTPRENTKMGLTFRAGLDKREIGSVWCLVSSHNQHFVAIQLYRLELFSNLQPGALDRNEVTLDSIVCGHRWSLSDVAGVRDHLLNQIFLKMGCYFKSSSFSLPFKNNVRYYWCWVLVSLRLLEDMRLL